MPGQGPVVTQLELKLASDAYQKSIRIEIYEGLLEDSVLYKTYETTASSTEVSVPINKIYTLVATYYIEGSYYKVINSVTPRARYDEVQCEKPCYFVINKSVDLRLRHVK